MAENDILSQFSNLQNTGMLSSVESLQKENKELKRIINDVSQLISLTKVDSMLDFVITKFLDYFIPENLVFIIKPPRRKHVRQYFYKRLSRVEGEIDESVSATIKLTLDAIFKQENSGNIFRYEEIQEPLETNGYEPCLLPFTPELIIPLVAIGGAYGVVIMSGKITGTDYSQSEITYMKKIFSILSITMQNGLHYESSITDAKTGLYTNDFFFSRLKDTISTVKRYKMTAAVLMTDIDFFKKFNDTYGHLVGDKILIQLAKTLQNSVRNEDCVARFGGEEFSVLLTHCTENTVKYVAERIRKAVEDIELEENGEKLKITISIGACIINDHEGLMPKYIIRKADQALYHSKENGRNQSTVYKLGLLDLAQMRNDSFDDMDIED